MLGIWAASFWSGPRGSRRPNSRVAVQIIGGLGNQLFQYAAGRALAERLGAKLFLDCSARSATERKFFLNRFPISGEVINDAPARIRQRYFSLRGHLGRRFTEAFHDRFPRTVRIHGHSFKVVYERRWFAHDARLHHLLGSVYLTGFWQSYRYFEAASNLIRTELAMEWTPTPANAAWLDRIRQSNSVCLHIRRGDYLKPNVQERFGICDWSYYDRAIEMVQERADHAHYFVFSDDLAWCRDHLAIDNAQFVDVNGPDDAADELRLMAACRHHVIANSSFSWWAAWLAHRSDQIVVAPDPWFDSAPMTPDLLPNRWIRIARTPGERADETARPELREPIHGNELKVVGSTRTQN
jgi:Glycosyl transferase family 11